MQFARYRLAPDVVKIHPLNWKINIASSKNNTKPAGNFATAATLWMKFELWSRNVVNISGKTLALNDSSSPIDDFKERRSHRRLCNIVSIMQF